MSGRPEILFPLFGALDQLDGIGPKTAKSYEQLGVEKPRDLLFVLPHSGVDRTRRASITEVQPGEVATVEVLIGTHSPPRNRGRPYRIQVEDERTSFQLVFFHARGDYLARQLPEGERRIISGKVEMFDGILQIAHPDHMLKVEDAGDIPAFEPVYPLTSGVTQKGIRRAVTSARALTVEMPEWIDASLKTREAWPDWQAAMNAAHTPENMAQLHPEHPARQRLAYDEFFAHQLTLALARNTARRKPAQPTVGDGTHRSKILSSLPYQPTGAQTRAIAQIIDDMAQPLRMNRLLQGDVGSGKTLVAFMALLNAVEAGGQGAMMAPTEILARQHLASLQPLAEQSGVVVEILTGRDKGAERRAKLKALAEGNIHILVGTHALFQVDVEFADLRLAIVDEQHRFGVSQRQELSGKGGGTHMLVMTATPIPRSLSLVQYGDMDVSVLDEKPPGRTPVKTALVSAGRMDEVVAHLRDAVAEGRQAYWVCPLVEESEVVDMTAAEERFKRLRAVLGDDVVGLVHGQMPAGDKDAAMSKFESGDTSVLVSTTVIEVGVNVPNASIMVIEGADHFGLAQLHQLRGRVGRGAAASTCLLMYQPPISETGKRRLELLRETEDGFRISEEDLAMRGAGDVIGVAQSGLPRFQVADMETQASLMAIAQTDARALLEIDPKLDSVRGKAARVLLWLMERDRSIHLISVG